MILPKELNIGGIMNRNLMNINDYINNLFFDKKFLNSEFKQYVDNCYSIQNVEGTVDADVLHTILIKACKRRKLRIMLSDILHYVNKHSITDVNFQLLLHFPKKYRTTYLSHLCHADLAFYQKLILCHYPLTFEAFAWIFDQIWQYDIFSDEDMLYILRNNPDNSILAIEECVLNAFALYGHSTKSEVANAWINEMKSKK